MLIMHFLKILMVIFFIKKNNMEKENLINVVALNIVLNSIIYFYEI